MGRISFPGGIRIKHLGFICTGAMALLIAGCDAGQARSDVATVRPMTHQDVREHNNWANRKNREAKPKPFEGRPLSVSGTGRVKATPDIAVITGLIKSRALADDVAVNDAANIINRVQDALTGLDAQMNFTGIGAADKRDDDCTQYNVEAMNRHYEIVSDNRFNQNIKNQLARGVNTSAKPRPPKPRIKTKLCPVLETEASIGFTLRVQPAGRAAGIISALTDAGVDEVDLFGYDYADYDALYKQAAAKAVSDAREKAQMLARRAGTQLTEITQFTVDPPERTARFGPQAMIISNHGNRNVAAGQYSGADSVLTSQIGTAVHIPAVFETVTETVVVQPQSVEYISIPPTYETVRETFVAQEASADNFGRAIPAQTQTVERRVIKTPASTQERLIPAVTKQVTRRVIKTPARTIEAPEQNSASTNALKMSLAGARTITVKARLTYAYETPIDGTLPPKKEKIR